MEHYQADLAEQIRDKDAALQRAASARALTSARYSLEIDAQHVELGGAPRREDRGDHARAAPANSTMTMSVPTAGSNVVMPWSWSAVTTPTRRTGRSRCPSSVPNSAMITDSQRIIERTWRRLMPTARSSPISRVRS